MPCISPLTFPGISKAVVKATSYEHDPFGITTEEADMIASMQVKRLRKEPFLVQETENLVEVFGPEEDPTLVVWGSTLGVAREVAQTLGLRIVQPLVLRPFPRATVKNALSKASKVIVCETNATGQLARLLSQQGIRVDATILRYDGRPFSIESLQKEVEKEL